MEKCIKLFNPRPNIGLVTWHEAWCIAKEYAEELFA
jgi:hypothetical protein